MDYLKDKRILALIAALLILVIGGVALAFMRGNSTPNPADQFVEENLPTLSAEDIGLEVTLRGDKRAIMFEVTKYDDIERIEYEITYEKEIDGETVPEGLYGEMNIALDGITKTDYREFGTCSSGVCRYDEVVSDIKITMKVTKKDGKVYSVEETVPLN